MTGILVIRLNARLERQWILHRPPQSSWSTTRFVGELPSLVRPVVDTGRVTRQEGWLSSPSIGSQKPSASAMLRQMSVSVSRRPFPHASRWRKPTTSYASSTLTSSTSALETIFPIWNQPKIESFGDYRQEAWLESHIGGPLYEAQASLPRLPVPEIAATLTKFLPTALPLARTNEEAAKLQAAVAKFPTQAAGLQQRLLARANEYHDSSWLQHWWNTEGYLKVRDPVVHNVSYFFQFADDPAASTSITRAAALLQAAAGFRVKVGTGALPQERIGKQATPLCSTAYKYMFHATRIPRPHHDSYAIYDPSQYAHAVVARKGYFFALDFCCPSTGKPYSLAALQDGLQSIVEQADQLATEGRQPHLGWLTSSQRDDWAKARQTLLDVGGEAMREALEVLQSGALMICLDDERPVSRREAAQLCLHGTVSSGHNRWFDKSIQLLVSENGKAGLLGEHSMMDGMPMVGLADELTKSTYGRCDHDTAHGECRPRAIFGNIKHDVGVVMEPLIEKGTWRVTCGLS